MKKNLFILLLSMPFFSFSQIEENQCLEIVSWNLRYFPFSKKTISYVEHFIKNQNSAIIALQEIKHENKFKELTYILDEYQGFRADPTINNPNNLALAFLFKKNITVIRIYEIFKDQTNLFSRPPLVMEIDYNNDHYIIINTHLRARGNGKLDYGNEKDPEYIRLLSLKLIKEFMDGFEKEKVILLGDFNDHLSDKQKNNVFVHFINDQNYFLADLFVEHGNKSNWSCPAADYNKDGILESQNFHFDHFITKNIPTKNITIKPLKIKNWKEYFNTVSDHKPVKISIFKN